MDQRKNPKLLITITERGQGNHISSLYTKHNIPFHFQCAARGTASSELLDVLGIVSTERDLLISLGDGSSVEQMIFEMGRSLAGQTGAKGIAFDIPLSGLNNLMAAMLAVPAAEKNEEEIYMGQTDKDSLILITVNQGYTEEVMETAQRAGARGGTILRARWKDTQTAEQFYGITLQEEREIIAILATGGIRTAVMEAVNKAHGLKSPAGAVICSVPVDHTTRL